MTVKKGFSLLFWLNKFHDSRANETQKIVALFLLRVNSKILLHFPFPKHFLSRQGYRLSAARNETTVGFIHKIFLIKFLPLTLSLLSMRRFSLAMPSTRPSSSFFSTFLPYFSSFPLSFLPHPRSSSIHHFPFLQMLLPQQICRCPFRFLWYWKTSAN